MTGPFDSLAEADGASPGSAGSGREDGVTPPGDTQVGFGGLYNLRPIGGHATAGGGRLAGNLLFRSADLYRLDDQGRRLLRDMGLRTIVDIRDEAEQAMRPDAVEGLDVRVVTLPLLEWMPEVENGSSRGIPDRGDVDALYLDMVRYSGRSIGAAATCLAQPHALPALIHCVGGQDRTGVVAAILLSALGVGDDDIIADYLRSGDLARTDWYSQFDSAWVPTAVDGVPPVRVRVDAARIISALAELRESHGSAEAYLLHHGVERETLSRLRGLLTVEGDPD